MTRKHTFFTMFATLAVAFVFGGCGLATSDSAATVTIIQDENGVTTEHDEALTLNGPVDIHVRTLTGDDYTVSGSSLLDAVSKLREKSEQLSKDLAANLADRPLFTPEEFESLSPEQKATLARASEALNAMPTGEELANMSVEERRAAVEEARRVLEGRGVKGARK